MFSLLRETLPGEVLFDELHCLGEPFDADSRPVEHEAELRVVGRIPSGAEAELDTAAAHAIQRRDLPREHQRVTIVVAVDERADANSEVAAAAAAVEAIAPSRGIPG